MNEFGRLFRPWGRKASLTNASNFAPAKNKENKEEDMQCNGGRRREIQQSEMVVNFPNHRDSLVSISRDPRSR